MVPYAALTHLFCWDNRPPVADITQLVKDGIASLEECQFLQGPGSSTFAIEYAPMWRTSASSTRTASAGCGD